MLSIRPATFADIDAIIQLNLQIWPQTYNGILQQEQIDYMLEMMYSPQVLQQQMDNGHTFSLCYHDDKMVGFAGYSQIEEEIYKLHKLYLLPAKQGTGVGRHMLHHIVAQLQHDQIKFLELNVNRYNNKAIAFYLRNGFTIYRDEDINIGNGYFMNDHVLRKQLL